jgi:hypothetical protein
LNPSTNLPEGNTAKPPSVDDRLALEAGLEKVVYHVGPVDVPTGLKADDMINRPLIMNFQMDKPVWVVGFKPRVVDSKGTELPSRLLHLAIVSNLHEDNPLCTDAGNGNPFMVATSLLTEVNLPQGYGYPLLATDPIESRVMLANETNEAYTDVYFEFTLLVKKMDDFANYQDVKPLLVEIDPCKHETVEIAPKDSVDFSASFEMPLESSLIVANGVLEDFGSAIELSVAGSAEPFWRAESVLDESFKITELAGNPFTDAGAVKFKEGDQVDINVAYDNFSETWIRGATAAALMYLAPKD